MEKRQIKTNLKKVKGRSASSTRWLQRQINDPYVRKAQELGLRGRAYFKLEQMDKEYHLFSKGKYVVDLGCAPGGWLQYAVAKTGSKENSPLVVGIDLLATQPILGAKTIQLDFTDNQASEILIQSLNAHKADIVMSDMAPNTIGIASVDHLRIMGLLKLAYDFAIEVLAPNGTFLAKIFQGGTEKELLTRMKQDFKEVKHIKPDASRKESPEFYVLAKGFKCTNQK